MPRSLPSSPTSVTAASRTRSVGTSPTDGRARTRVARIVEPTTRRSSELVDHQRTAAAARAAARRRAPGADSGRAPGRHPAPERDQAKARPTPPRRRRGRRATPCASSPPRRTARRRASARHQPPPTDAVAQQHDGPGHAARRRASAPRSPARRSSTATPAPAGQKPPQAHAVRRTPNRRSSANPANAAANEPAIGTSNDARYPPTRYSCQPDPERRQRGDVHPLPRRRVRRVPDRVQRAVRVPPLGPVAEVGIEPTRLGHHLAGRDLATGVRAEEAPRRVQERQPHVDPQHHEPGGDRPPPARVTQRLP